jgi:hypothetical protein
MESNEGLGSLLPYEKKVIDAIEVNRVLLEGLRLDSAAAEEGERDRKLYNYSHDVKETRDLIVDRYGRDLIDSDGFNHHPELQMFPLSIKEVRNEVFRNIEAEVRKWRKAADRGYFFLVGLGGGTGTGLISPLAQKIGEGLRGYFALGALSGGEDKKYLNPQQPWFRRCFNILIALNDLIATARLGGLILVDNEKIIERLKGNLEELGQEKEGREKMKKNEERIDEEIIRAIFPAFAETACEDPLKADWSRLSVPVSGSGENKSPIFVPCYASGDKDTATLIAEAISKKGMLANLNIEKGDHKKADKIFVFTRKIGNRIEVKKELWSIFDKGREIGIIEKNANNPVRILNDNEIIVLESAEIGMDRKENEVLVLLRNPSIKDVLCGRLEVAKSFVEVLNMLVKLINRRNPTLVLSGAAVNGMITRLNANTEIVADLITALGLHHPSHQPVKEIILEDRRWVIIDEEISYFIKKNNTNLEIYSIKTDDIKHIESESILTKDKEKRGENELLKEILREAIVFLFPKDVVEEKEEEYYVGATKILEKLNIEADHALTALGSDNWPIFKKRIFEIKPALATNDEIDVTTMLASEDISDALGPETVNNAFYKYQTEALKDLKALKYVEGSDSYDYNLTDEGEKILSALGLDEFNIDEEIKDPYSLFKKVQKQKFLDASKRTINDTEGDINFPKLLILSLLYTKWEPLFSLDKEDKDQIRESLTKNLALPITDSSIFNWEKDGTGEILNISGGASGQIGILIDNEEDIKKIHVGSFKKEVNANVESIKEIKEELDKGKINLLWDTLNSSPPPPQQYEVVKEEHGYSIKGGGNNNFYIYIRDSNSLRVYEDRSADLKLRVRESGNKLKVYRRREKKP